MLLNTMYSLPDSKQPSHRHTSYELNQSSTSEKDNHKDIYLKTVDQYYEGIAYLDVSKPENYKESSTHALISNYNVSSADKYGHKNQSIGTGNRSTRSVEQQKQHWASTSSRTNNNVLTSTKPRTLLVQHSLPSFPDVHDIDGYSNNHFKSASQCKLSLPVSNQGEKHSNKKRRRHDKTKHEFRRFISRRSGRSEFNGSDKEITAGAKNVKSRHSFSYPTEKGKQVYLDAHTAVKDYYQQNNDIEGTSKTVPSITDYMVNNGGLIHGGIVNNNSIGNNIGSLSLKSYNIGAFKTNGGSNSNNINRVIGHDSLSLRSWGSNSVKTDTFSITLSPALSLDAVKDKNQNNENESVTVSSATSSTLSSTPRILIKQNQQDNIKAGAGEVAVQADIRKTQKRISFETLDNSNTIESSSTSLSSSDECEGRYLDRVDQAITYSGKSLKRNLERNSPIKNDVDVSKGVLVIPKQSSPGKDVTTKDLEHQQVPAMSQHPTNGVEMRNKVRPQLTPIHAKDTTRTDVDTGTKHTDADAKNTDAEEEKFLEWLKSQFVHVAGEDNSIDRKEFKHALGIKNNFFADRFFALFDIGNSDTIDLTEFINGVTLLVKGTPQQKLEFLFKVYDVNGNGAIEPEELKTIMYQCMVESNMKLSEDAVEALTAALFESADTDQNGCITFEELCAVLDKHPDVLNNLTISAAQWLKPPRQETKKTCCSPPPKYLTSSYYVNNKRGVIWFFIYILINIGLFLTCIRYRDQNPAVIIARGCGMCLNFNCAFILVLMLHSSLTILRMTPLRHILPIDESVFYHKMVGYIIVILSLVHTVAHYVNVGLVVSNQNEIQTTIQNNQTTVSPDDLRYWQIVLTLRSEIGYVGPGFAYLSGLILVVILLIMFICALPFIRRKGYFQVFYYTHLLYIVFWVMLILHGPLFWCFLLIPGLIFIIEKVLPSLLRRAKGSTFHIRQVKLLPSKVTQLVIRCKGFHFKPGDYVFINVPAIAKFEYHPFTISSAPQRKGEFWLHIRSAGHWTNRLYKYFEEYGSEDLQKTLSSLGSVKDKTNRQTKEYRKSQIDFWKDRMKTKNVNMKVSIRGPFGTPTREIFDTEHAVLIASGIGVTPFASILQSIMYQVRAMKKTCPHCTKSFLDMNEDHMSMTLKKVDFIWINRDHHCFEWFIQLLQQLEDEENEEEAFDSFLDMHLYMTSALSASDMKGFAIQMALDAMQQKGQRSVVTGLKKAFKPGRPNWKEVFKTIKSSKKGQVKVFYCGNPALSKTLKQHCDENNFEFSKESF